MPEETCVALAASWPQASAEGSQTPGAPGGAAMGTSTQSNHPSPSTVPPGHHDHVAVTPLDKPVTSAPCAGSIPGGDPASLRIGAERVFTPK